MNISDKDKLLLRQFNVTHSVQIKLKKIKVNVHAPPANPFFQRPTQAHGKIRFTCNECDYTCFSKKSLKCHMRVHKDGKLATKVCPFCKKVFRFYYCTERHMKICKLNPKASDETWVAKQKQFKCKLCAFATVFKSALTRHLRTHADGMPFECSLCRKNLKSLECLKLHQSRHSDKTKKFHCSLCPKRFHSRTEVNVHIFTHTGERPFKCQFCEKRFKANGARTVHVKVCKENPLQLDKDWVATMKKHNCHLCSFSSVAKQGLINHFRTHTGERPFHCGLCSYKSSTQHVLNNHVRVHTGEKPFKCSQCTYTGASILSLTSHFKHHHSTEPRQKDAACSHCSKSYYSRAGLNKHMKLQHGKKSRYSRSSEKVFDRHDQKKTEKPFNCSHCTYTAATKSTILTHYKRVHSTEPRQKVAACCLCPKRYYRRSELNRHMKLQHAKTSDRS